MSEIAPNTPAPSAAEQAALHAANTAAMNPLAVPDAYKVDGKVDVQKLAAAYLQASAPAAGSTPAPVTPKAAEPPKAPAVDIDAAFRAAPPADLWKTVEAEVKNDGDVSPATKALMAKQGIPESMISGVVGGIKAERAAIGSRLAQAAGGEENLRKVIDHVRATVPGDQLPALRNALEDPVLGPVVMRGLAAGLTPAAPAATPAAPREPKSILDITPAQAGNSVTPFASSAEMLSAFKDPRYFSDPAFRELAGKRMLETKRAQG